MWDLLGIAFDELAGNMCAAGKHDGELVPGAARPQFDCVVTRTTLFYVARGFAYGGLDSSLPFRRSAGGTTTFAEFDRQTHFGYTVGVGAEAKVVQNFSAKNEYLYVDLAEQDYAFLKFRALTSEPTADKLIGTT